MPVPRHIPSLARALALPRAGVVAFVGAGGKTSSIRRVLRERADGIATTTTHLACSGFARGLLGVAPDGAALEAAERALLRQSPCTLALRGDGTRLHAPDLTWHERFARRHPDRLVLVEADGAARRALKLPASHEPAWPPYVDVAVVVLGAHALGRALADAAHHPERFRAARLGSGAVEVQHFAAMLTAYAHRAPPGVALRVLLRGVGAHAERAVRELVAHAQRVVRQRDPLWNDPAASLRVVAIGEEASACVTWSVPAPRRRTSAPLAGVCGVLLAAGHGSRFEGAVPSKLLARWRGRPLVAHATRTWSRAGFAEMLIITGHAQAQVEDAVEKRGLVTI